MIELIKISKSLFKINFYINPKLIRMRKKIYLFKSIMTFLINKIKVNIYFKMLKCLKSLMDYYNKKLIDLMNRI